MGFRPIFGHEFHQDTAYHRIATEGMLIEFQLPRTSRSQYRHLDRSLKLKYPSLYS